MAHGYYCLIQFCPDASRAEAANVGLLLYQVDPPAAAVRVVDDVGPAMRRVGQRGGAAAVRSIVQSTKYRIEREQFGSVEALERFVRTRGNQIQLTTPRPMRIEAIAHDVDEMFTELVGDPSAVAASSHPAVTSLQRTFLDLAKRMPQRVLIAPDFHVRGLDIPVRADFAYRNGCLNLVREVPSPRQLDRLRFTAMALSKEGELVRDLEEGIGKLIVVSPEGPTTDAATERERQFGDVIRKLGGAEFVPNAEVPALVKRVEAELAHP